VITGVILFVLILIFSREKVEDLYHDRAYWIVEDDGISDRVEIQNQNESEPSQTIEVSQGGSIKGEHAYL
jgi:hypothetical protein